jgi:hypothetical protein
MPGHECYHCKQWVEEGEAHDCWTTTEGALTRDLSEDLQDAYARIRETAAEFGEQRIYASHNSIMFSRTSCYFFVRPRKSFLEVWFFLDRAIKSPQIRRAMSSSRAKVCNMLQIRHRDEVEAPVTDWLREAYERSEELSAMARKKAPAVAQKPRSRKTARPPGKKKAARRPARGAGKKRGKG